MVVEGTPSAQVVPSEVDSLDIHVGRLLHYREVDADAGTGLEVGLDVFHFLRGAKVLLSALKDGIDLGSAVVEGSEDAVGTPEEHARVPEEFTRLDKHPCQLLVRLFGECLDRCEVTLDLLTNLDVPIAGFGTAGLDAHRHQRVMILDEVKGLDNALPESLDIQDQVVTWSDHHLGVGVDGLDVMGGPCNTRRGVAPNGLEQYLVRLDFRQLLLDERLIVLIGDQDDVIDGYDALHAVKRHLQQAPAGAKEIDELLRLGGFAEGPEAASDTTAHDNAKSVVIHD